YELDNHLGSATLELDTSGNPISYEEYHPYGTTAYRATTSVLAKNPKRYAFTGKERDESTGLYYHGARYYAPWLGRWVSTDPARARIAADPARVNRTGSYAYVDDNPIRFDDPSGNDKRDKVGTATLYETETNIFETPIQTGRKPRTDAIDKE